ncbi:MAG: hypothetical protein AAF577_12685 [Pseudomonadota bacterium]
MDWFMRTFDGHQLAAVFIAIVAVSWLISLLRGRRRRKGRSDDDSEGFVISYENRHSARRRPDGDGDCGGDGGGD